MLWLFLVFWPFRKVAQFSVASSSAVAHLSILTASREYANDPQFRKFRRQLFHTSLGKILECLRPHMTTPKVTKCGDGHYRRVIYGLGPYIADYPEQALLACIVQGWCPKYVVLCSITSQLPADGLGRCTSPPNNLDDPGGGRRSHEHTDALLEGCTLKELWDDFGIVGDLEVS